MELQLSPNTVMHPDMHEHHLLVQSISEWFSKMANGKLCYIMANSVMSYTHGQQACCQL